MDNGHRKFDNLSDAIFFAGCVISTVVFTRVVPEAFDLPKVVFLVTVSWVSVLLLAIRSSAKISVPKVNFESLTFMWVLVGLLVSAVINPSSQLAWIGQEHRYTGTIFWICILAAATAMRLAPTAVSFRFQYRIILLMGTIFLTYGLVQILNWDPYSWNTETFAGGYVFSTQGNPNFASWTAGFLFGTSFATLQADEQRKWKVLALATGWLSILIAGKSQSIQGSVMILMFLLLWLGVSLLTAHRSSEYSLTVSTLLVLGAFASVFLRDGDVISVVGSGVLIVSAYLLGGRSVRLDRRIVETSFATVCVGILVLGFAFRNRLDQWMGEQLSERSAFYRAALGMFGESPIFGNGFDRYGRLFTRYRPSWHAESLSNSISGSAHSIWLGLLVSGGLLLVVPILLLVLLAIRRSFVSMWETSFAVDQTFCFSMTLVLPVIAFVSVEQASVIAITFVFVVMGLRQGVRFSGRRMRSAVRLGLVAVCIASLVAVSTLGVRWMAGNKAQNEAYKELFGSGDLQRGLTLLDRAADWGPHPSEVRAVRANVALQLGDQQVAVEDSLWVSREYEYSGYGSLESARILGYFGQFEASREVVTQTILNNRNNPALLKQAYELMAVLDQELGPSP